MNDKRKRAQLESQSSVDDAGSGLWRHVAKGIWKNAETAEELAMPVCVKCAHTACPVCATWCDVLLQPDGKQCCDGDCTYTRYADAPDHLDGRPHMCRFDDATGKRSILVM